MGQIRPSRPHRSDLYKDRGNLPSNFPEACRLVFEAGTMGHGGEIFVLDMGEPVKIVDLAKRMIVLSGAKDVKIDFSSLRDGEKLYEELLATKENTMPTFHSRIMAALVRAYPYELALKNEL